MNFSRVFCPAALVLLTVAAVRADVTLPAVISDNMVLQQRSKVNVWGKADPGETVTVQIGPEQAQATTGKDGTWGVKLPALKAGGPYDMSVSGKNSITVHNVVAGDVWLCAGESNMDFKVISATNGIAEAAQANLPMIREFKAGHVASGKPAVDCEGVWVECGPDTVKNFSAVGYFFAKELNEGMRIPIGIVESAWGPSPAEAWTPRTTLEKDPALKGVLDRYTKAAAAYPDALSAYQTKLAAWKDAAKAGGSPAPRPIAPLDPGQSREPAALYNGMIAPLTQFPVRGILWYQGESNTGNPGQYRTLFPAMIEAWRKNWVQGSELPFLYVQLPGFLARHTQPVESNWAGLREAQAAALSVPKTGMAVTIDLGEEHNIHPADKQDVAHRLALLTESQVYGKSGITVSGPAFTGMSIDGSKAVLSFSHEGGGLSVGAGGSLKGFAIAGSDRRFVWGDAEIHDGKVIVQSKEVPKPVAVRYAWADMPDASLTNTAGLPAAPFRTDNWVPGEVATSSPTPSPTPAKKRTHHHKADE